MNWFRHIRVVTADDKADFEVMLLDHANIEDAKNALLGISMNLIEHGLNLGLMDLLLDAADIKNVFQIRNFALNVLISMMAIYDDAIRKQEDFVDRPRITLFAHVPGGQGQKSHILCRAYG